MATDDKEVTQALTEGQKKKKRGTSNVKAVNAYRQYVFDSQMAGDNYEKDMEKWISENKDKWM